jgi:2-succinyl-5-enolpyruvyl-6-hydroxy-3-cyclohexene-1-carboxylate synthase
MGNLERASGVIASVRSLGVQELCVCAGSRNAALLAVLGVSDARLYSFVDERSAAFFALGRMKLHGAPVAVVTTSGTAVAELLAATIEAHYAGLPLILITADRPASFRGTGAPQSIEQIGIFGVYAETDPDSWTGTRPLHINVEFEDEPLTAGHPELHERPGSVVARKPQLMMKVSAASPLQGNPLVIVGGLTVERRERVRAFVKKLNAPTYAEPLSGLREDADLPLIRSGERMIARASFDRVIRIGNVPTLRYWRDLEAGSLSVAHFSDLPFPGLTRGDVYPIEALPELSGSLDESFAADDAKQAQAFSEILNDEPESELAMIRRLSQTLPAAARVYLGNSLPIREWDLAATRDRSFEYQANRGANGIDGQLSTFFGWCAPNRENVCVVGDLTAIYDLNAPWILRQLEDVHARIVIVNNGGGRIFSRVPSLRTLDEKLRERVIENSHDVHFEHWAKMWDLDATELRPDAEASRRAWAKYDALWS